ncbi:MAG: hypothetical protein H6617_01155 [Bdellovibrionaceae bacterium]|nr:hypothetical protein [Pseudobdellovibrionaceae bacterium]
MRNHIKHFLCLGVLALLSACASVPRFQEVAPGMTAPQVSEALGEPKDRTFRGKKEKWSYPAKDGKTTKIVVFENGHVVEMVNTEVETTVMDQAGKDGERGEDYCEGSNNYGKFPKGGGCNLYGCWPAGGYCNGFGCSASGVCTVDGCPKKIASYQCKD